MSLLVISEIFALFVNILNADHSQSLCNRENLQQSIQMKLSKNQKNLSEFFVLFLKSTSTFQNFEKNDDPHNLSIFENTDHDRRGQVNV